MSFNPRARVGRDLLVEANRLASLEFQSTRPRGARRLHRRRVHAHVRVSIHAPAWGATTGIVGLTLPDTRFNPRARVGRDPARCRMA